MYKSIESIIKNAPPTKVCNEINKILNVKLPHKGVKRGNIVSTGQNTWTSITFPQWVKGEKTVRFLCTPRGGFAGGDLSWT